LMPFNRSHNLLVRRTSLCGTITGELSYIYRFVVFNWYLVKATMAQR